MLKIRRRPALNDENLLRVKMTPQMLDYDRFASRSIAQHLPYLMGFNPADFESRAINTDYLGFRFSHDSEGNRISVGTLDKLSSKAPVNLLVGGSPALGYGATSDETSVVSRLAIKDPDNLPWLNLAGHCYNSVQELLLFILHLHRIKNIKHIVIMGGFNTLVMARLPEFIRGGLPPFYFCGDYFNKFDEIVEENGGEPPILNLPKWPAEITAVPPIKETLDRSVQEMMHRLNTWRLLASSLGAKLTFILQPLATWVREPCVEEKKLFDELDAISKLGTWEKLYGDISSPEVAELYANSLSKGCAEKGISFGSLVADLRSRPSSDWLFVDRAHFTDHGNDVIASAIQKYIQSSCGGA
ncbi:hypothetical protein J7J47_10905 [Halomonas sp. ISL-60]|uniref:hypothetical protein n=1 Tax=Halomonas sp. ISL-56 TaxID=2819149 RepID=UPI001BE74A20|nr:hypothetical protein [Halomonas sp. ISL-56]MBT2772737.1 hypothetical protein [Halomonas sp. ISL-60]MBT2800532.1 hypothetical protein [Halomonas sp. ISL-56]